MKEELLQQELTWVIKAAKLLEHVEEVPNDIAKQYMALAMSNRFNERLKVAFPKEEIFLKYIKPYIVLPLFQPNNNEPYVYEMEKFLDTNAEFNYYSRPKCDLHVEDPKLGVARLPHAFTHWTYEATGN